MADAIGTIRAHSKARMEVEGYATLRPMPLGHATDDTYVTDSDKPGTWDDKAN